MKKQIKDLKKQIIALEMKLVKAKDDSEDMIRLTQLYREHIVWQQRMISESMDKIDRLQSIVANRLAEGTHE